MNELNPDVLVREATPSDVPAIRAIYAYYVLQQPANFEEIPPDAEEMLARMKQHGPQKRRT